MANFELFKYAKVRNHVTGAEYKLVRASQVFPSWRNLREICQACNEAHVYQALFCEVYGGRAYSESDARAFLAWAHEGWKYGTHYVFFLLAQNGEISGCLDIKSNNLDIAEIGYWASASHRGVMTNALAALCEVADRAGFRHFYAEVRKENSRSSGVLHRLGFVQANELSRDVRVYDAYVKRLGSGVSAHEAYAVR